MDGDGEEARLIARAQLLGARSSGTSGALPDRGPVGNFAPRGRLARRDARRAFSIERSERLFGASVPAGAWRHPMTGGRVR